MTTVDQLPQECLDYVHFIEEFTGVRVSMISVGPDRVNIFTYMRSSNLISF